MCFLLAFERQVHPRTATATIDVSAPRDDAFGPGSRNAQNATPGRPGRKVDGQVNLFFQGRAPHEDRASLAVYGHMGHPIAAGRELEYPRPNFIWGGGGPSHSAFVAFD
jgi:hypothetical protein